MVTSKQEVIMVSNIRRSTVRGKTSRCICKRVASVAAIVAVAASLAACVASESPLVSDAQPVLGRQFTAQVYRRFDGAKAGELKTAAFRWKDGVYVKDGADESTLTRFVSEPLQGDDTIIQGWNATGKLYSYWIGRKVMPGAYLVFPVDEANASNATRDQVCVAAQPQGFCIVKTHEQLMAMALATARAPIKNGEVAVIVEDGFDFAASAPAVR
jgi:hypothetical protein